MGLFDFLFKKKKISLEDANKINQDYIAANPESKNEEQAYIREASSAMTSGKFDQSRALYQKMAVDYPENSGLYLSQVGVAYYFQQDYANAIKYYIQAKDNGADANMIDDNLWEVCEEMYENDKNDTAAIEKYLAHYPNGSYVKKAKKILSK
ncbi:hypothetical protein [uncultured Kordia sp.]|uniref:tetratricopeptide repeat protein n=1 Tax=uncultured Kordia sp. TaxID=507699 RepID=UPI00261C4FE2|nr:hypothetical protein [uncultured Kordia sp.]